CAALHFAAVVGQVLQVWELAIPLPAVMIIIVSFYMMALGIGLWIRLCLKVGAGKSFSSGAVTQSRETMLLHLYAPKSACYRPIISYPQCEKWDCACTCQPPECESCNCLCFEIRIK
uniref:Uncharacterized protein n=1 Tax=Echeneis naucrates TaxID=173247 RepID=A0A665SYS8_ECHNA